MNYTFKIVSNFWGTVQEVVSFSSYFVDAETSPEWPLVKAADTISAYMKCVKELKAGNDEFKEAHDSILAKLKTLNMPEVDMFLQQP